VQLMNSDDQFLNMLEQVHQIESLIVSQFDGLVQAYSEIGHQNSSIALPTPSAFQILNAMGDLIDLTIMFPTPSKKPIDWYNLPIEEIPRKLAMSGHCSALVKILGNYSEIFASHSTWFSFQSMNRIYKHYQFNLTSSSNKGRRMSFSSYPGILASIDDFYMMDSGLIMLETTNNIINQSLYQYVVPQSLLAWQRVRLANLLADSGASWSYILSQYNSGTYNNQYMIVDTKLFTPGEPLPPNVLWIAEQIPTLVESADLTETLARGYWPSYNVPFFAKISEISGWTQLQKTGGTSISYELAPRAEIFRRDEGNVVDMNSMKYLMRYNEYKTDPYSEGNPGNAICSRFDLEPTNPSPSGCYDTKVTTASLSKMLISESISGPTYQGLPPFSWNEFPGVVHDGQPTVFDFPFLTMQPISPSDEF